MDVAILGAGVGGLATAIALRKQGFGVRVYERHRELSSIGAGVVLWPNAAFVLERLGLQHDIEKVSGRPARMRRVAQDGEELSSLDIRALDALMGRPSYAIFRRDLMALLERHALAWGATLHYDHEVVGLESRPGRSAEVRFANDESAHADIVLGADGRMSSVARRFVLGTNAPVFQGFVNWIGVFESDDDLFSDAAVSDFWGIGERFGIVPVTPRQAYWAAGAVATEVDHFDSDDRLPELVERFRDWPSPIARVIAGTLRSQIRKIYVHDHNPVDVWHRDNVLLLGDAAHAPLPTSGQGACQALEDAWHVAEILGAAPRDVAEAFARFTALRHAKTAGIIHAGRQLARSIFDTDPEACRRRNERDRAVNPSELVRGIARGWGAALPLQ